MKLPTEAQLIPPADKGAHFIAGAVIFAVAFIASALLSYPAPNVAMLVALAFALAKEALWDAGGNYLLARRGLPTTHDVDAFDFIATAAGAAIPYVVAMAALGMLRP